MTYGEMGFLDEEFAFVQVIGVLKSRNCWLLIAAVFWDMPFCWWGPPRACGIRGRVGVVPAERRYRPEWD
jgi:hypothetical protein